MRAIHYAFAALLVCAPAFAADVYRSVAPDGTIVYSDRPEGDQAELLSINVRTPAAPPRRPAPPPRSSAGPAEDDSAAGGETEQTAAERAEERARNCEVARERAERYSVAHRLYRTTPDGEREYLSDAEIDAARARAAADVDTWCD